MGKQSAVAFLSMYKLAIVRPRESLLLQLLLGSMGVRRTALRGERYERLLANPGWLARLGFQTPSRAMPENDHSAISVTTRSAARPGKRDYSVPDQACRQAVTCALPPTTLITSTLDSTDVARAKTPP